MAFFSIITPTLNRRPLLERVARCLEGQTFNDWEWCVVNDGSNDDTRAWLESQRDPRVKVAHFSSSKGVAAARNQGLLMAAAPWLTFLDDDDYWEPDHLQVLFTLMEAHHFHHAVYKTGLVMVHKRKKIKLPILPTIGNQKFENLLSQEMGVSYALPTSLSQKIRFEEDMSRGSDEYFLWRVLKELELFSSEQYTVYYDMTNDSLSRGGIKELKVLCEWVYSMEKLCNLLESIPYLKKNHIKFIPIVEICN